MSLRDDICSRLMAGIPENVPPEIAKRMVEDVANRMDPIAALAAVMKLFCVGIGRDAVLLASVAQVRTIMGGSDPITDMALQILEENLDCDPDGNGLPLLRMVRTGTDG